MGDGCVMGVGWVWDGCVMGVWCVCDGCVTQTTVSVMGLYKAVHMDSYSTYACT